VDRLDRKSLAFGAVVGALLLCGVLAWIAIIALAGRLGAALIVVATAAMLTGAAWWLHTINDREARAWLRRWRGEARGELPRAQARPRHRGRR
jgi:peptidoglycan/LPS O-acetylase OafA/YrhL